MNLIPEILAVQTELMEWRRDLHAYPELAFQERRTAEFVATKLAAFGIEVTRGVGTTGVVGTLSAGSSTRSIGLRADMDALPMDERNTFAHKSKYPGCMHGCGHDGHTVSLLAAARYLAESKQFDGTVHFIFQPAEEANAIGSGAKAMIDDGLFERFPIDSIFAIHNAPELALGVVATCSGAMTASMDLFDVTIHGKGTHGAQPHTGIDPVVVAAQLVTAWQSIVSRNVNPQEGAVISATAINAGDSWNVIPDVVQIKGSVRTLSSDVREMIKARFNRVTHHIAEAFGVSANIDYRSVFPVMVNNPEQTQFACDVAATVVGRKRIIDDLCPDMGSEDFAFMLQERPGCYLCVGAADIKEPTLHSAEIDGTKVNLFEHFTCRSAFLLHDSNYDFNDELMPIAATFFVRLTEQRLFPVKTKLESVPMENKSESGVS